MATVLEKSTSVLKATLCGLNKATNGSMSQFVPREYCLTEQQLAEEQQLAGELAILRQEKADQQANTLIYYIGFVFLILVIAGLIIILKRKNAHH